MRAVLPERLHPLDPVRSIKAKLGLLVAVSISVSALLIFLCLVVFGWRARYGLTVSVLVGLAVTQLLARGMTSPLRQMTAAAREMAAGRTRPVSATSRDEVGELARAFTAMAADLASADGQRRDLLANVAHELRTPVAALRAQLENLVDGVRPADEVALAEALGQVENISGLLDDLLDLARAEAGVTPIERSPVDVPGLVGAAVAEIAAIRPDRRLEVDVAGRPDRPRRSGRGCVRCCSTCSTTPPGIRARGRPGPRAAVAHDRSGSAGARHRRWSGYRGRTDPPSRAVPARCLPIRRPAREPGERRTDGRRA